MKNGKVSVFALCYSVFALSVLVFAGCKSAKDHNAHLQSDMPLDNCSASQSSLQPKAGVSRIRSTDLTSGQYDYSSGEVFIETKNDQGTVSRAHAIESIKNLGNGQQSAEPRLICKESIQPGTTTSFQFGADSPRTLRVKPSSQAMIDTAFRGVEINSVQGSLNYRFKDGQILMGQNRVTFEAQLGQLFDQQYFVSPAAGIFQFVGEKTQDQGKTKIITRITFIKSDANMVEDGFIFDPIPDSVFDF